MNFAHITIAILWLCTAICSAVLADPPVPQKPVVDQFGQPIAAQYPVKIKSEADLKKDAQDDQAYYASLKPPKRDLYGGLLGSKASLGLKETGFFHVEKHGDKWHLVDPQGNLFYVLGIAALGLGADSTYVGGRPKLFEWIPSPDGEFKTAFSQPGYFSYYIANLIRKFGKPYDENEFSDRTISRVQKWGFNAGGPFTNRTPAYSKNHFVYAASLPADEYTVPSLPGISRTFDPFEPKNRDIIEHNFAKQLPPAASDPLILGYFLTNEPLYETIPQLIPQLDGSHACKQHLVQFLRDHYQTLAAFNTAWDLHLNTFDELGDAKLSPSTPAARKDVHDFMGIFLDAYFKLIADTFHKYDKHHMLLGNRFQSGTINDEQLCRIAGKYLDIMSFNYYTWSPDKNFLDRIYQWTGRPMLMSEYYYVSTAESGLTGGNNDMLTQALRGRAYRHYVEQSAAIPYMVGAQWFMYGDEPATGWAWATENGEHANTGLVNVTDRPYKDMLTPMMETNYSIYDVVLGKRKPYDFVDDPRFQSRSGGAKMLSIARATGPVPLDGTGVGFPGLPAERISGDVTAVGKSTGADGASLKACWDDTNLYLLLHISDKTPMENKNIGADIWQGDGIEVFIGSENVSEDGALLAGDKQILISAGKVAGENHGYVNHGTNEVALKMFSVMDVDGNGYTLQAAIPFAALGFTPHDDQVIRFDVAVDDSIDGNERISQYVWNGNERNSGDRSNWGRAKFVR